jgi:hypothetical protein
MGKTESGREEIGGRPGPKIGTWGSLFDVLAY